MVGDAARLDGQLVTTVDATWMPFDRLTAYDDDLKPQPMLAESWEFSSDFKQLKLNLRKGVQFHTGRELTSDDVKWNLDVRARPEGRRRRLILQSKWFTTIETPDKYTVILASDSRDRRRSTSSSTSTSSTRTPRDGPMQTLVGTGPFKFVEWAQGDHLLFRATRTTGRAACRTWTKCASASSRTARRWWSQLESGQIDAADQPPLAGLRAARAKTRGTRPDRPRAAPT